MLYKDEVERPEAVNEHLSPGYQKKRRGLSTPPLKGCNTPEHGRTPTSKPLGFYA